MHRFFIRALLVVTASACLSCSGDPFEADVSAFEWIVSTPQAEGMDARFLDELTPQLSAGSFGKISSLLVVKSGRIVYEQYFRGMSVEKMHVAYSVTKSVTSALVGIAIEEGEIESTEELVTDLLPGYKQQLTGDRRSQLSLSHVLQMRGGFDWNELQVAYGSPQNVTVDLSASSDWVEFALSQPMKTDPGESWTYNGGLSLVLGAILERAVGKSSEDYARSRLFGPIGIQDFVWEEGRGVTTNTAWGLSLTARDMARFGLLYLQDGVWGEQQIIPAAWIKESFQQHSSLSSGFGYGYQWWLMPVGSKLGSIQLPYADGYGDQLIVVIPHLDMVVVSTAEHYEGQRSKMRDILNQFVIPAVPE